FPPGHQPGHPPVRVDRVIDLAPETGDHPDAMARRVEMTLDVILALDFPHDPAQWVALEPDQAVAIHGGRQGSAHVVFEGRARAVWQRHGNQAPRAVALEPDRLADPVDPGDAPPAEVVFEALFAPIEARLPDQTPRAIVLEGVGIAVLIDDRLQPAWL